jgi:uncharacterized YigZ family protein
MQIPPEDLVRTIASPGSAETRVRGSRFLALAAPASTREDAEKIILAEEKKYHAATHHCRAWRSLEQPEDSFVQDDDGEPSGSAGQPILQAIQGAGLCGTVVVVTRYFGGVKLGVGGLVRAYGEAASLALADSVTKDGMHAEILSLSFEYSLLGRINQVLESEPAVVTGRSFTQEAGLNIAVALSHSAALREKLVEAAAGRIKLDTLELSVVFPEHPG